MQHRILICDDEEGMRRYLAKMLSSWGYLPETFATPVLLLHFIENNPGEGALLLLDVKMPGMDGLEVLRLVRKKRPELPVVMMTGHGTIESAVEAMKIGAYDYLAKPFPQEKLAAQVNHCIERGRLLEENASLKNELKQRSGTKTPVFVSECFKQVYELALRVAATDSSVLISGESGTGKELIASTLHDYSPRADSRFLAINCAALSETLLESQLFGHLKGAFTGALQNQKGFLEEADEGTLFLDEIGDLSLPLQAKLLRVLQEGELIPVGATRPKKVDVRFIAATNKDLEKEVQEGRFREDLFYRLNVIALELPPLRQRPEDVEPLAQHFLDRISVRLPRQISGFSSEALKLMRDYRWPGNVRELQNIVERGAILALTDFITPAELPFAFESKTGTKEPDGPPESEFPPMSLRKAERLQVVRALEHTDWNKSQSSILLGITRKTLDRKIKEYNLTPGTGDLQ
jgi:two-component system response regulator HydG